MRLATHTPDPTPDPNGGKPTAEQAASAPATHRACPACHEVWPTHMMEPFGERLLCKPCRHNAEAEANAPKRPSYMAHLSSETIRNWGIGFTLLAVAIYMGVRMTAWNMRAKIRAATRDVVETTHSWAKKPAAQWPVLSMNISQQNGGKMPDEWQLGPNACLIQRKDGSIVCASTLTERATLALADRVNSGQALPEPVTYQQFAGSVRSCDLSAGKERVAFSSLLPDSNGAFDKGLVFFAQPADKLPKEWQPFHMREGVYMGGMKMTVLARDSESGAQVPIEAMVVSNNISSDLAALANDQLHDFGRKMGDGSESLITLSNPYSAEALIGAPVVDVRGNLAAIITMAYSPTNTEGLTTDFVAYGMHALKSFTAPEKK